MFQTLAVSTDQIVAIEKLTRGQHTNKFCNAFRCGRLTASNVGLVLRACRQRQHSYPPSLFKSLFAQCDLSRLAAVRWGLDHEQEAVDDYIRNFCPVSVSEVCLLYTSPSPRDGLLSRMPSSA